MAEPFGLAPVVADVPTYAQAMEQFYTTGRTDLLEKYTRAQKAAEAAPTPSPPGGFVPPDLADPAVADWLRSQNEAKGGLLPVSRDAAGKVSLDLSAGLPGTIARAVKAPGDVLWGRLHLPMPGDDMGVGYKTFGPQTPDPEAIANKYLGLNWNPTRATRYDEALEPVFDLGGVVMGGGLPAAEKGAVGIAGGRLRPDAMEAGRLRAIEQRNQGIPTGKDAPGWSFRRPEPEIATPERDAAVARAEASAAAPEPASPLMRPEDVAAVADPAFASTAPTRVTLPVSEHGQGFQSLLDSFEAPAAQPVTSRDVTLGSGDVSGTGQARTAAVLGLKDSRTGLYSALERAVDALPEQRAPGQQWLNTLMNRPGVKPEELDWTGLRQFLEERRGQPVTKQDIAEHVASNRVGLNEVNKGEAYSRGYDDTRADTKYHDYQLPGGENYRETLLTLPSKDAANSRDAALDALHRAKQDAQEAADRHNRIAAEGSSASPEAQRAMADYIAANQRVREAQFAVVETKHQSPSAYRSSHWDEPNPVVHMRMNDRVTEGGPSWRLRNRTSGNTTKPFDSPEAAQAHLQTLPENLRPNLEVVPAGNRKIKSLHLEEIQSDWHQAGRKQGYNVKPQQGEVFDQGEGRWGVRWPDGNFSGGYSRNAAEQVAREGKTGAIPDAPFKKTWHELALKRALTEAAQKGYDRLSWTPGAAQAERYDLSKHIDSLKWYRDGDKYRLSGSNEGRQLVDERGLTEAQLENYIGKDLAEKIVKSPEQNGHMTVDDMKVGGAGMTGFYDKMVPQALEKIGKPWGLKVKKGEVQGTADTSHYDLVRGGGGWQVRDLTTGETHGPVFKSGADAESWMKANDLVPKHPVWYVDIPEKMRNDVKQKGFALFAGSEERPIGAAVVAGKTLDTRGRAAVELANEQGTAAAREGATVGDGGGRGLGGGNRSLAEAQAQAERVAAGAKPLPGLPRAPVVSANGDHYVPGPIGRVQQAANDYMATTGRKYEPPTQYHPLDKEHSASIAKAFDEMKHAPDDPAVKASYDAMIDETLAQWDAIKKTGLKVEFIKPGMEDPYFANPRLAAKDVADNNHLWVFPTSSGHGTLSKISDNPLLRDTGQVVDGHRMVANDVFRIVHDYFGHLKEGHGFRAAGEDNAWRSHAAMYSDLARPAMTTETRGQNSWVNYGPHGEKNRTANAAETVYADQKVGLMPDWTMRDRGVSAPAIGGKAPLFDYSRLADVPDVPQHNIERRIPPRGTPEHVQRIANPENIARVNKLVEDGIKLGGLEWYNTMPMRDAWREELGLAHGDKDIKLYLDLVSALSPRSTVGVNARNAAFYYHQIKTGGKIPKAVMGKKSLTVDEPIEKPFGHIAQGLHASNVAKVLEHGGWPPLDNPKPASFAENLSGNYLPLTSDTHNARMWGLTDKAGNAVDRPEKVYHFMEQLQQEQARRMGLTTAQYQASGWIGAGGETGLKSSADPFVKIFAQLIKRNADRTGQTEKETLQQFIRGNMKLYAKRNPIAASAALLSEHEQPGVVAYHGTPHKFDRFDMSKIGTGEGENVFGRGLYFGGAEDTAKHYRDVLTKPGSKPLEFNGKPVDQFWNDGIRERYADELKGLKPKEREDFVDVMSNLAQVSTMDQVPSAIASLSPAQRLLFQQKIKPKLIDPPVSQGHLYQVAIDADPAHFLRWESLLDQQSPFVKDRVMPNMIESATRQQEAMRRQLEKPPRNYGTPLGRAREAADRERFKETIRKSPEELASGLTGAEVYKRSGLPANDQAEAYAKATEALRNKDIPGLRYRDAISRNAVEKVPGGWVIDQGDSYSKVYKTEGAAQKAADKRATDNYVVFRDDIIRILKRYGIALPGAAGAAAAAGGGFGSLAPQEQ